jgi:hypothetical protein
VGTLGATLVSFPSAPQSIPAPASRSWGLWRRAAEMAERLRTYRQGPPRGPARWRKRRIVGDDFAKKGLMLMTSAGPEALKSILEIEIDELPRA